MTTDKPSPYGNCPQCGAPGISRERRPNGNDKCSNGHTYPSANSIKEPPSMTTETREMDALMVSAANTALKAFNAALVPELRLAGLCYFLAMADAITAALPHLDKGGKFDPAAWTGPVIGSVWTHHSGREYVVTGFANTESTRAEYPVMIVYKNTANGTTWTRRLDDWHRSMTLRSDAPQPVAPQPAEPPPQGSDVCDAAEWVASNCDEPDVESTLHRALSSLSSQPAEPVAGGAVDVLPPLPKCWTGAPVTWEEDGACSTRNVYTDVQMYAYARAAIAALRQQKDTSHD